MREESAKRRTSTSHHSSGSSSGSSSSSSTAWRLDDSLALRFIGIKTHPYLSLIRHKIRDDDEAAPRRLLTNRISVCWLSLSSLLLDYFRFLSFSLSLFSLLLLLYTYLGCRRRRRRSLVRHRHVIRNDRKKEEE